MLYHWYELGHAAVGPARMAADASRFIFTNPFNPMTHTPAGRQTAAACEVFERTTRRYRRPSFGITSTRVGARVGGPTGARVAPVERDVEEEVVWETPFCRLIHFRRDLRDNGRGGDPRVLIVAPMSGHFATLLRGTVEALLPEADVYITDWQDARQVPLSAGEFDLDTYVDTVRGMLRFFHGDVHVFAVCQPSVPVLAAVSLMEADGEPHVPHSMVLAGGPIDTRVSPTAVNQLAQDKDISWFQDTVITTVPWPHAGHGREVYPGFLQLTGFMTMNLDRHLNAHRDLFDHLVAGDGDSAEKHRDFYDEYLAVMDLTAEFYLETVESVFIRHALPKGEFRHRGRRVDPGRIRRVALMTVEGEKDDITGLGQCAAAHDLCRNIPAERRAHLEAQGVGHYGIFNGSRFRTLIAPQMLDFMRRADTSHATRPWHPVRDSAEMTARAKGAPALAEDMAFTFAPANDVAEDPVAKHLKRTGLGKTSSLETMTALETMKPTSAPLQFLTFLNNMMVDQLFSFAVDHRAPNRRKA